MTEPRNNLVIDLGNSRIKWAQADKNATLSAAGAVAHEGDLSAWERIAATLTPPRAVWVVSVAPPLIVEHLREWARTNWHCEIHLIAPLAAGFGLRNGYDDPRQLGADRWAAMVAAYRMQARAVCVIDCGTALTLSAIDDAGAFVGGAILPGVGSARACVVARTHAVEARAGNAQDCLARNTADALAAGTAFGAAGAIARIVQEYRQRLGASMQVIVTGGEAPLIAPLLTEPALHVPDLVLQGVALIAQESS